MKKEVASASCSNSFGIAAVILGIMSIVFASINGLIFGIIALVFAQKQQKRSANSWGRAGKILSIIGIVLSIILLIALIWASNNPALADQLGAYNNALY